MGMPWASPSLIAGAVLTGLERRQIRKWKDRILEVRLTDLVARPEETMRRVLDHVGEPWSDQVLDHPNHGTNDLPPMPWFESASGARKKSGGPRGLDGTSIRLLEFLNRKVLRDQGLEPMPLAEEPGFLAVAGRYLRDLPLAVSGVMTAIRLARASRSGLEDHDRTQALLHQLNPAAWKALGDFRMPPPPPLPAGWEAAWPEPPRRSSGSTVGRSSGTIVGRGGPAARSLVVGRASHSVRSGRTGRARAVVGSRGGGDRRHDRAVAGAVDWRRAHPHRRGAHRQRRRLRGVHVRDD